MVVKDLSNEKIVMPVKQVTGRVGFKYSIFLTLIHYTTAWILLAIFKSLVILPVAPPKKTPFSSLFASGAVMAFASGLANTSLNHNRYLSDATMQVIDLVVVSFGVAVATVTDLEFNILGACVAIAWIIPNAINKILWSNLQQQGSWTAIALMWKTTPATIFFLLALMPWLDPPGVLLFKWDLNNTTAILISVFLGFLLQWSGALALGATSATSHVVLGQFKTCVILLGGYLVFGSDPGVLSIIGAVIALGGMTVYTSLNLKKSTEKTNSLNQLPSVKPKTIEDEEKKPVAAEDNSSAV